MSVSSRSLQEGVNLGSQLGAPLGQYFMQKNQLEAEKAAQALRLQAAMDQIKEQGAQNINTATTLAGIEHPEYGLPTPANVDPAARAAYQKMLFDQQLKLIDAKANADQPFTVERDVNNNYISVPSRGGFVRPVLNAPPLSLDGKSESITPAQSFQAPQVIKGIGSDGANHNFSYDPATKSIKDLGLESRIPVTTEKDANNNLMSVPTSVLPGQSNQPIPVTSGNSLEGLKPVQAFNADVQPNKIIDDLNKHPVIDFYNQTHRKLPDIIQAAMNAKHGETVASDPAISEAFSKLLLGNQALSESDKSAAYSNQAVLERLKGLLNQKISGGAGLSDNTRAQIVKMATQLDNISKGEASKVINGRRQSEGSANRGDAFDSQVAPNFPFYGVPVLNSKGQKGFINPSKLKDAISKGGYKLAE